MTKRDELVKILEEDMVQHQISGFMLNAPMSHECYDELIKMFDKAYEECQEIGDKYIADAKQMGNNFTKNFEEDEIIASHLKVLTFFDKYKIIRDADIRLEKFSGFITKTVSII